MGPYYLTYPVNFAFFPNLFCSPLNCFLFQDIFEQVSKAYDFLCSRSSRKVLGPDPSNIILILRAQSILFSRCKEGRQNLFSTVISQSLSLSGKLKKLTKLENFSTRVVPLRKTWSTHEDVILLHCTLFSYS